MSAAAAGAHAHAGGPGAGAAQAAPVLDMSRHKSGIVPVVQSVAATANLGCQVDLMTIALRGRCVEYDSKRRAAVTMRRRRPYVTAVIFASGVMKITGAKSEAQVRCAARKFARSIQRLGFPVQLKGVTIDSVMASCDVHFPVWLERLAYAHPKLCSYEPELSAGLTYRMATPKVVLRVYVSGKVTLTGGKSRDDIYEAFEKIYPVLSQFRKVEGAALTVPPPPAAAGARGVSPPFALLSRTSSAAALAQGSTWHALQISSRLRRS